MDNRRNPQPAARAEHSELNPINLEDFIEPVDQEELQAQVDDMLYLIELAKECRKEVFAFDPQRVKREPQLAKMKRRLKGIQQENKFLEEKIIVSATQSMKREAKAEESHCHRKEASAQFCGSPRAVKPKKGSGNDTLVAALKDFNKQAHNEIMKLSKEIEASESN